MGCHQSLAKAQRALSRKQKFSNNWKKAKGKVQKIHTRIGNARRDYLHKTTTTISKNHAVVSVEDLQVRNMSKSAAGRIGYNWLTACTSLSLHSSIDLSSGELKIMRSP